MLTRHLRERGGWHGLDLDVRFSGTRIRGREGVAVGVGGSSAAGAILGGCSSSSSLLLLLFLLLICEVRCERG